MLAEPLSPIEARIIGALIEKELTTPDHYPLSLNALVAACNQSSNRDPVMQLDDETVSSAVVALRRRSLVRSIQGVGSRVPKFQHLLSENEGLTRAELAVICVLLLRGPQTLAELRSRAARMTEGEGNDAIESAVEALLVRTPVAAITRLPRRPGQKEVRYAHLLSGAIAEQPGDSSPDESAATPVATSGTADRLAALEETTRALRAEVDDLRAELASFRKQFE